MTSGEEMIKSDVSVCPSLFSPKPRLGERNSHIPIPETLPEKVSDYDQTLEGFVTGGTQDRYPDFLCVPGMQNVAEGHSVRFPRSPDLLQLPPGNGPGDVTFSLPLRNKVLK